VGHPLSDVLASQERTLSWLARKTGKSPSYVLRVTTGERNPSEDFKARAAEALGVPVALLFPEQAVA
jgi:transcriptional regulator with XRE-family HTH domain